MRKWLNRGIAAALGTTLGLLTFALLIPARVAQMSYVRTTSGLLARFESDYAGTALYPFVTADWTAAAGLTLSLNAEGALIIGVSGTDWLAMQYDPIASRSKAFIYAQSMKTAGAATAGWHGIGGHITDVSPSSSDWVAGRFSIDRPTAEQAGILQAVADALTDIAGVVTVANKDANIGYQSSLFYDGTSFNFRDIVGATTRTGTATPSNGKLGFVVQNAASRLDRWIAAIDRYVLVHDVPTGGTAEIVNPTGGAVVAATAESSGTVTLDLHGTLAHTAHKIIVRNSSSAIVATIIPGDSLVAGGDVFEQGVGAPPLVDPSVPEERTDSGAWSPSDEPHAIRYTGTNDRTYFAVGTSLGVIAVVAVDHATGVASRTVVGTVTPGQVSTVTADKHLPNAHISPTLRVRSDGKLQVFWTGHNSGSLWRSTSVNAEDISAWEAPIEITTPGSFTYPIPVDLSDRVVLHWRQFVSTTDYAWYYAESTDDGATFGAAVKLLENDPQRPYLLASKHPALDRIDYALIAAHPAEGDADLYHFYRSGTSAPSFFKTDGTLIGTTAALPLAPSNGTLIWDVSVQGKDAWQRGIAFDRDNEPTIIFNATSGSTGYELYHARWDGAAWQVNKIADVGGKISANDHDTGAAALDPDDDRRVWVSIQSSATVSQLWEYLTYDRGATWEGRAFTSSGGENIYPVVPQNRHVDIGVLWQRGSWTLYDDFATAVFSLGIPAALAPVITVAPISGGVRVGIAIGATENHRLYISEAGGAYTLVANLGDVPPTTYDVTGLDTGIEYCFKLTGYDPVAAEDLDSNIACITLTAAQCVFGCAMQSYFSEQWGSAEHTWTCVGPGCAYPRVVRGLQAIQNGRAGAWVMTIDPDTGLPYEPASTQSVTASVGIGNNGWMFHPWLGNEFAEYGIGALVSNVAVEKYYGVSAAILVGTVDQNLSFAGPGCPSSAGKPDSASLVVYARAPFDTRLVASIPIAAGLLEVLQARKVSGNCPCGLGAVPISPWSISLSVIQELDTDPTGKTYRIIASALGAAVDQIVTMLNVIPAGYGGIYIRGSYGADILVEQACVLSEYPIYEPPPEEPTQPPPEERTIEPPTLAANVICADLFLTGSSYIADGAGEFASADLEIRNALTLDVVYTLYASEATAWQFILEDGHTLPQDVPLEGRIRYRDASDPVTESEWSAWTELGTLSLALCVPGAPCDLVLQVFEADRETLSWEAGTNPSHPNPYLLVPDNYAEQEIDIINGAATIGQLRVTLIDKATIRGDQDSGWLMQRLAELPQGRRQRVLRYIDVATGWIVLVDGPGAAPQLHQSYAGGEWVIRDTRETERKTRVFEEAVASSTILPQGVLDGFGYDAASDTWLIAPTVPIAGTNGGISGFAFTGDPAVIDVSSATAAQRRMLNAVWDATLGDIVFVGDPVFIEDITFGNRTEQAYQVSFNGRLLIQWRLVGETDWNIVRNPIIRGTLITGGISETSAPSHLIIPAPDDDQHVLGRYVIWEDADGLTPFLGFGANVELIVLRVGEPSELFPFHIEGITTGELLRRGYSGYYSRKSVTGALIPTGIIWDDASLNQMTDLVRLRLTEPVEDFRSWAETNIYAASGWVPALDLDAEINPVSQIPPEDAAVVLAITNAITNPQPNWSAGERIVNHLTFEYPRFYIPAVGTVEAVDGILVRQIKIVYVDDDSITLHGEQAVKYDGSAFGAVGTPEAAPLTSTSDELGYQLAESRRLYIFDRYRNGAQMIRVPVMREHIKTTRAGDWVRPQLSWFPDYTTGRRGMDLRGQVMAIADLNCAWREVTIEEALHVPIES